MMDESQEGMIGAMADLPDVSGMNLEMTKDQKLRAAALILGIRYHVDTIIKDAEYLKVMIEKEREAKFSNDPDAQMWHLRPTTVNRVIHIANEFEQFLLGNRSQIAAITDETIRSDDGERAQGSVEDAA